MNDGVMYSVYDFDLECPAVLGRAVFAAGLAGWAGSPRGATVSSSSSSSLVSFSPFSPLPGRPSSIPKLLECPNLEAGKSVIGACAGCACAGSKPLRSPPKLTFRRCFLAVVVAGALRGDMNEAK